MNETPEFEQFEKINCANDYVENPNHLNPNSFNFEEKIDYKEAYKITYEELVSQQSKRDIIFGLFLGVFSFATPLIMQEGLSWFIRGWMMLAVSIIGLLSCFIIKRYRLYKESYWLACRTLNILSSYEKKEGDTRTFKQIIQSVFLYCMIKNSSGFTSKIKVDGEIRYKLSFKKFFFSTLKSAETTYLLICALITSALFGVFIGTTTWAIFEGVVNYNMLLSIIFGAVGGLILFVIILLRFASALFEMYKVVENATDDKDAGKFISKKLNKCFKYAWTLHMYFDVDTAPNK